MIRLHQHISILGWWINLSSCLPTMLGFENPERCQINQLLLKIDTLVERIVYAKGQPTQVRTVGKMILGIGKH